MLFLATFIWLSLISISLYCLYFRFELSSPFLLSHLLVIPSPPPHILNILSSSYPKFKSSRVQENMSKIVQEYHSTWVIKYTSTRDQEFKSSRVQENKITRVKDCKRNADKCRLLLINQYVCICQGLRSWLQNYFSPKIRFQHHSGIIVNCSSSL